MAEWICQWRLLIISLFWLQAVSMPNEGSGGTVIERTEKLAYAAPLASKASMGDVSRAREIVTAALNQVEISNSLRIANPIRNQYYLKPGTKIFPRRDESDALLPPAPFNVTDEIANAAALVAEVDASEAFNGTQVKAKRAGTWWMGSKTHRGSVPWGNDSTYQVRKELYEQYAVI
jgi:hypothetical protein